MILIVFPTGETGFFGLPLNTGAGFYVDDPGSAGILPIFAGILPE